MPRALPAVCIVLFFALETQVFGWDYDPRVDPVLGSSVFLSNGVLEPTREAVVVPGFWRGEPSEDSYDYYLVLLTAPATREKRDALRGLGAEIIEYYHYNSYIVRLPSESLSRVGNNSVIAWYSLWHPWYKLSDELRSSTGTGRGRCYPPSIGESCRLSPLAYKSWVCCIQWGVQQRTVCATNDRSGRDAR